MSAERERRSMQPSSELRRGPNGPRGGPGGHRFGMPGEKAKDFRGTMRRLLKYLRPHQFSLGLVLLFAVLGTVFGIAGPKIMGKVTTALLQGVMGRTPSAAGTGVDFVYIGRILASLVWLYVASALFNYIQQYAMAGIAQRIVYQMRREVREKLGRLPLRFFDTRTHGDILSRVTNDVDAVSSTLQQSLVQMVSSLVTMVGVVVMMLTISPSLTLLTLVTVPLSIFATMFIAKRSQKHFVGQQKALGDLNGHVEEMYSGHRVVKAFGRERASQERFEVANRELYHHAWKAQFMSGIIPPLMNLINNTGYVIVCVAGGVLVTQRRIQIGDVQAFISYSQQFSRPIAQTSQIVNVIQSAVAAAERVFEILDEPEEIPDAESAAVLESPRGDVRFEGVSFSYREDTPLIQGMDIDVREGQTVAIVGPTGAGKTTLVNLLERFYDVGEGRITVDGVDIRALKRSNLRSVFGMVLQDTWLFSGTIRDNIAYGREGATDEQVVEAARAAHADHFIRTLPAGYDTVLNEDATNISQGQMQLLTIARAFLADPAILILDEATSSVDTRTEIQIQTAMKRLMVGRTSFVIAHRLSTIRDADLILVMNEGQIVEGGTHRDLLARKGFYADLYNSQFSGLGSTGQAAV